MPIKWECFLIIQVVREAELLSQDEGVDSAQPVEGAERTHCDLKFPDYQKAVR